MKKATQIESAPVFWYFEKICAIPHGSGDMDALSEYCMRFAEENGLQAVCDEAKNVVQRDMKMLSRLFSRGILTWCARKQKIQPWTLQKTE